MYVKFIKRGMDVMISFLLIIILLPIFVLVAFLCLLSFEGKIIFTQQRVGKDEQVFTIFKFISMKPSTKERLSDTSRLTPIGRFLRRSSLDELPQLINVLKGDMSLIGPRPLLIKYLPYYYNHEKIRHEVRPGITGLAQINGRNNTSWDERLNYDCMYVKSLSFRLDAIIFFKTLLQIFYPKNIQSDPRSLMADLDVERKASSA